ncbi:uncharacterized protein [Clinocottus analis]|uniref:uncharacterized protein n=1 Tax=Clinocottus analis TaxID=304258 RepID=UPI0035C11372
MNPVVQCDNGVMTFTASGRELQHLFVDRERAAPISLFQLPPYCRYSVRKSRRDLEMMVPYDACYVTQQNGSYVLPMKWWGSPVKLSCPVQMSNPAPPVSNSALFVLCSSYGMAVQINGLNQDVQILGVIVKGRWSPFVSEECAYRVTSHTGTLTFIPYSAPCLTSGNGLHLLLNYKEYIFSCPLNSQFPYILSPPQLATQEQMSPLHVIPHHLYPGFQYPHFLQVPLSGPQPTQTTVTQATPSPNINLVQESSPPQSPRFLHKPLYYPAATPAATSAPKESTTTAAITLESPNYPGYYWPMSYYPAAPGTQAPASFEPDQPPVGSASHPRSHVPVHEVQPAFSAHPIAPPSPFPPTTTRVTVLTQPSSPSYPSGPYPFYPYHPPYQPLPQNLGTPPPIITPTTPPTTTSTASSIAEPTSPISHLHCLVGRLVVSLPFANPDTIQVRDQTGKWLLVSAVSPQCGYMLQSAEGNDVILHSPLPACHSQFTTPMTISLTLRFWDLSAALYRSLDLRCPYPTTNEVPVPVYPATPSPDVDPTVPKPKVYCSSHQMTVELPSGLSSGIVFKDIKGNEMSFLDAPEHCGYSVRKGQHGNLHLTIQLLSRCHMSMQGNMYTITVVYMTVNGTREAQFSCPVVIRASGQECNLPSEQHLPCGPSPVSKAQCLSMGCCFDIHPPACYYPMDECTIDRHFVFSVPASLMEPPLSPALLVVAGNSTCKPQRVTADYALFKIPLDGCGTRRVAVGSAVIYMVEIINKVQTISLNYGTITRDSPVSVLVECRILPDSVLSVSYLVKTPTLAPEVPAQGMFGVQLRIAKDAEYSSFYPQNHPPLKMLLGKPLYLEVRLLNSSDPSLVLLVHFCVAYPASGKAVWLLLYNGCSNPMVPALQQAVLSGPRPYTPQAQTRRFTISTFQFLPGGESMDLNGENNFMCSTEICSPSDGPCVEGCFGQ